TATASAFTSPPRLTILMLVADAKHLTKHYAGSCFFFDNGRCMFCPGSGTKQAQPCVRREGEMNKRKLGSFALCAMLFALCASAEAQQPTKVPRIGYLAPTFPSSTPGRREALRQGLRELGYVDGKNIVIEYRFAEEKVDRLSALASELVRL